jgi:glycosyltransferase involved in cell wall biosynthesis
VVYDAHELETEQGWPSHARTVIYRAMERRMSRRVDAMLTVSGGIARWYRDAYGIPLPEVVRNVPERPAVRPVPVDWRGALRVPDDALLFLFLGALAPQRGIEQLLEAFASPGVRHHLLCIGYGPLAEAVRAAGAACPRIHYRDAVPPSEVLRHAAGADVGVTMTMDTCLSHHWSLPNKLFEAIMAGLPVLVSDLPEIRNVVEAHDAGWITRVDAATIAERLRMIDVAEHRRMRAGLADRTAHLGWHQEAEVLLGVYRRVLGVTPPAGS